jgi:hypothetical protein
LLSLVVVPDLSNKDSNQLLEKLEEIKEQAKAKEAINANEKKLTPEQQEIKGFVDERNIIRLIHFTRYENLESILTNGLITRDGLNGFNHTVYVNDSLRLDGHTNSISLSLSFPNHRMFYKYRMGSEAQGWVVLAISPEVLWDYECAFCKHNAFIVELRYINWAISHYLTYPLSLKYFSAITNFGIMNVHFVNITQQIQEYQIEKFTI